MDATFTLAGITDALGDLLDAGDFAGAEELISQALGQSAGAAPFLHFQMGRLYVRWNKLTSAIHHLGYAAELAKSRGDEILLFQIMQEFKTAKGQQAGQRP